MEHQLFIQDRADRGEAAGAVEKLQRQQVAVAGAEGIEHMAAANGIRYTAGGGFHSLALGFLNPGQEGCEVSKILINGSHRISFLPSRCMARMTAPTAGGVWRMCGSTPGQRAARASEKRDRANSLC